MMNCALPIPALVDSFPWRRCESLPGPQRGGPEMLRYKDANRVSNCVKHRKSVVDVYVDVQEVIFSCAQNPWGMKRRRPCRGTYHVPGYVPRNQKHAGKVRLDSSILVHVVEG